jgi:hypothetical protein
LEDKKIISRTRIKFKNFLKTELYPLKGVGVADLGFCYADSRQTGSGNDSKTCEA